MVPDRGDPKVARQGAGVPGQRRDDLADGALLPAALVGLAAQPPGGRVRSPVLLAWLPVTLQNQYFLYHAAALPVVGAVCLYGALRRVGPLVALPVLALSGWTYYVLTNSADWRVAYQPELFTIVAVVAGVMVVLSIGWRIWRYFRPATADRGRSRPCWPRCSCSPPGCPPSPPTPPSR